MWMMGYNDGGELNLPDSFNGRKLRPIVPRPGSTSLSSINNTTPCLSRIHKADLLSFNHHLGVAEQNKREVNAQQVVVSSRWNPTPEQLQTLEELYRRGTRTPSADQIQHITSQLRRYGKIEGKNVFYWFQNHKARERQKRRRQLESEFCEEQQQCRDVEITPTKDSGANRTGVGVEIEQTKGWAVPTNCTSTTLVADQKNASILRAAVKAGAAGPECRRADGRVRFDEGELHQRTSLFQRNATWQMMQLSCSPPLHTTTASVITTAVTSDTVGIVNPKFLKSSQDQTLQLFPLRSTDDDDDENSGDEAEAEACHFAPYPFFEFLPLKN